MDLSFLPPELVEEVAAYLNVADICACLAVSREWKRAFDTDRIWRRFCTFHQNYFSKQELRRIKLSQFFVDSCKARKNFGCERQVMKNLVKGNYDLIQVDIGKLYCDNLVDVVDDDGNHWLFVSCMKVNNADKEKRHLIEVWKVNDTPVKNQSVETPIIVPFKLLDSEMKATKNKLYYSVDETLIAFEFSHPEYELTFLFQLSCPSFEFIKSTSAITFKSDLILGFIYSIAHYDRSAAPWVHVWRADGSLLYKNYSASEVDETKVQMNMRRSNVVVVPYLKLRDGGSSDNVLLGYYSGEPQNLLVVLFSVKTFEYTTLLVLTSVHRLIYYELLNEVVVAFYHQQQRQTECLSIHTVPKLMCCSIDGNLVYEPEVRTRGSYPHYNVLTANEGKEVLILDSYGYVTAFDVFQQKEISDFQITKGDNIGTFIKNNLVIIQQQLRNETILGVWDFTLSKQLYQLNNFRTNMLFNYSSFTVLDLYKLSFMKSFSSPPKIFAIKEPEQHYSKLYNAEIMMISFL